MSRARRLMLRVSGPVFVLALWEGYTRSGSVDPIFLPAFSTVVVTFFQLLWSGELLHHSIASLQRVFAGFIAAAVAAVTLGLLIGWVRIVRELLDPLIEAVRPVSPISLIPLAILWFGIGPESKIVIIFIATFFPILLNTIAGVQNTDPRIIRAARALGAGQVRILRTVSIPSAAPFIYTGLRISMSIAFIVIIASEMVAAQDGLGWLIIDSQRIYRTDMVFVGIVTISGLGLLTDYGMRRLGRLAFPWMQTEERK